MKIQRLIRFLIALALTYGVYTETGIWTALSIFMAFIAHEFSMFEIDRIKFITGGIMAMIFKDDFEQGEFPDFVKNEETNP